MHSIPGITTELAFFGESEKDCLSVRKLSKTKRKITRPESRMTNTLIPRDRPESIFALGGFDVCDGVRWRFVMRPFDDLCHRLLGTEGAAGLGVISRLASPVARKGSDGPRHGENSWGVVSCSGHLAELDKPRWPRHHDNRRGQGNSSLPRIEPIARLARRSPRCRLPSPE